MKRLILLTLVLVLAGCSSTSFENEFRNEAATDTNEHVLNYVVQNTPECRGSDIAASLYSVNLKEMTYRESKGQMNAQADAEALQKAKASCQVDNQLANQQRQLQANYEHEQRQAKYDQDERLERLCEAAHPYMVRQCLANSGVDEIIDAL